MLSEQQQRAVWENWLASEMRANYFADMAGWYRRRQSILTWLTLVFSSGAAATLITDWLPVSLSWIKAVLSLLTAAISLLLLVQQNQKLAVDCTDLHFRWNLLSDKYETLWNEMHSENAEGRLQLLRKESAELSKSGTAIPYKEHIMLKWQDYVQQHHGVPATA